MSILPHDTISAEVLSHAYAQCREPLLYAPLLAYLAPSSALRIRPADCRLSTHGVLQRRSLHRADALLTQGIMCKQRMPLECHEFHKPMRM